MSGGPLSDCHTCGDAENARHEIAGHENAAPDCKGGKCETWKCEKRDSMEHSVLHMSVHCRAGMHESTRKCTRFRRQLCSWERRICAKCVSSSNVMHDLRLCRVGISVSVRRAWPSWNNRRAGAPSAGLTLPWFCVCTSLTVMTWTIISWYWLSVTNVFLHLHKLCSQLCCQLCCTDYIFIIRFYSAYICHLKSTATGRTLRLHLKIDFNTDLTSNITRHSCTISAELVVSNFINNWNYLSFRCILVFFVFVCCRIWRHKE